MATPNIFLHYWNDSSETITFQEVLAWEIPTPIIEAIQTELLSQLNSSRAVEIFPNFPWSSPRFEEKWAGIAQTLLYQVSLPEFIWASWIESISVPVSDAPQPSFADLVNSYEAPDAPASLEYEAPETPAEPFDLLNTEVYFEAPESLEDSTEEEYTRLKDLLSGSSGSLKSKVESQMTQRIADTISLHQRIHFIQELFRGDVAQLESLIQYIDEEAEAETWATELLARYQAYRATENEAIWEELHLIIERKFN
ncbi:MAG: hypothetical protein RL449_815 [Bacteroidota bacterium]|jgi:hypothetical protein